MITVQAIYHTARTAAWHDFARDLGLAPAGDVTNEWAEFDGDGILSVRRADAQDPAVGTALHVLTDDLPGVEKALHSTGVDVRREQRQGHEPIVMARTASGATITASAGARPTHGTLRVQPIWSPDDAAEAAPVLRALGLRERIRSDSGTWIDFVGDGGGLVAYHAGMSDTLTLSMEFTGDLDGLARHLTTAGHEASIVDEAYNRTLLVRTPDDWTLWINGPIIDLYGYRRADPRG